MCGEDGFNDEKNAMSCTSENPFKPRELWGSRVPPSIKLSDTRLLACYRNGLEPNKHLTASLIRS
jgi:hypothetical protein